MSVTVTPTGTVDTGHAPDQPVKGAASPDTDPRSAPGPGPGPGIPGHPADPGSAAAATQSQARPPAHPEAAADDSPERKKAVEDARKAGDHPATEPATPGKRPPLAISVELAEARARLADMQRGTVTRPDTPEVRAQRAKAADAGKAFAAEREKLDAMTAGLTRGVNPDDLHAQHYAVRRLEDELRGAHETSAK